ncbi:MAG: hypothetical protein ACE5IR_26665 [bacterium]
MNERILKLLYRSFDAPLSQEEEMELLQALSASSQLREEQKRLAEMRGMLKDEATRSFRPFFAARVMHRIKHEKTAGEDFVESLVWIFRRIALAGGLAILFLVITHLFVENHRSLNSVFGIPQYTLAETWQLEDPLLEETQ